MNLDNSKLKKVKNIILDFGGVVLDIDFNKTYLALSELIGQDIASESGDVPFQILVDQYERGMMNTETFLWNIQRMAKPNIVQPLQIIEAWNKMLQGWKIGQFQILYHLKRKFRSFLLSNTNEIHIDHIRKDLKKNYGIAKFEEEFFEKVFYSFEIGLRKPEIAIYKYVLESAGIIPEETCFIDDRLDNIEAADGLGFITIHHERNKPIDYLLHL